LVSKPGLSDADEVIVHESGLAVKTQNRCHRVLIGQLHQHMLMR